MATPEGKVKAKIDKALKELGVWFFSPQAGPYGRAGVPDRIVCAGGIFVGIEAKADATKKPTRLQIHCMGKITAAGGKCFVVYDDASLATAMVFITKMHRRHQSASSKETEGPSVPVE